MNNIRDWELDWSLKGAKLLEDRTLQFDTNINGKEMKHILYAEAELVIAKVFFGYDFDDFNHRLWRLDKLQGAVLVIRKPRKVSTEVKHKLKPPFNIYRKTKHKKDSIVIRK